MFKLKLYFVLFLTIFITRAVCDEEEVCPKLSKISYSVMLCDEAIQCPNETSKVLFNNFRDCLANTSDVAKPVVASGNKLPAKECIKEVFNGICPVLKQIKEKPSNYETCFKHIADMPEEAIAECLTAAAAEAIASVKGGQANKELDPIASLFCTDLSKIKCNSKDAMEVVKLTKTCLKELPGIKDVNTKDIKECKTEVQRKLMASVKEKKFMKMEKCMASRKDLDEKDDPFTKCTGFE